MKAPLTAFWSATRMRVNGQVASDAPLSSKISIPVVRIASVTVRGLATRPSKNRCSSPMLRAFSLEETRIEGFEQSFPDLWPFQRGLLQPLHVQFAVDR